MTVLSPIVFCLVQCMSKGHSTEIDVETVVTDSGARAVPKPPLQCTVSIDEELRGEKMYLVDKGLVFRYCNPGNFQPW